MGIEKTMGLLNEEIRKNIVLAKYLLLTKQGNFSDTASFLFIILEYVV